MRRSVIIALVGALLAACSTPVPAPKTAYKHVAPKAWIDPPQVGAGSGVPSPAGLSPAGLDD